MAKGYFNARYESVPGTEINTPTLSTKSVFIPARSAAPKLGVGHLNRDDEIRNLDEPVPVVANVYSPEFDLETRGYPDTLGFLLKAQLGNPVTTAGNGVITDPDGVVIPTGAFRHVFTAPFGPTGASPQTIQAIFAYADQGVYLRAKGAAIESIEISTPEDDGMIVAVAGPALVLSRIADPSLSPAYESLAIRPFTRGNLTLNWLASSGTTEDFTMSIASPVETVRSLGVASRYPDLIEKAEGPIVVTGTIPKRALTATDWDALLNATEFTATARWVGTNNITGSYPYKFIAQFDAVQLTEGDAADLTNNRRIGAEYSWRASTDGAGASATFTVVNSTASYL